MEFFFKIRRQSTKQFVGKNLQHPGNKIHNKIGPAKAAITKFAKNHPVEAMDMEIVPFVLNESDMNTYIFATGDKSTLKAEEKRKAIEEEKRQKKIEHDLIREQRAKEELKRVEDKKLFLKELKSL